LEGEEARKAGGQGDTGQKCTQHRQIGQAAQCSKAGKALEADKATKFW
jgi:hypothetical protein